MFFCIIESKLVLFCFIINLLFSSRRGFFILNSLYIYVYLEYRYILNVIISGNRKVMMFGCLFYFFCLYIVDGYLILFSIVVLIVLVVRNVFGKY